MLGLIDVELLYDVDFWDFWAVFCLFRDFGLGTFQLEFGSLLLSGGAVRLADEGFVISVLLIFKILAKNSKILKFFDF